MKYYFALLFIITIVVSSCKPSSQYENINNTKPMYGEVPKSEDYKKIDEEFIQNCLKECKTIDSAVNEHIKNAWWYFYHDSLQTAMKRFNQVWLLNPNFPDSYFGFAALLETQGNNSEAQRFYAMALEKDKNKDRAELCYQRIADCKEQLKDYKGTIEAYIKISELNPKNDFAFDKIGFFQAQLGNSVEAFKAYNKALSLNPGDANTYNNRGYLNQSLKKYPDAIADYSEAIKLEPKNIRALANRAMTGFDMKDYKRAINDFESCVQLEPKDPSLRRLLGIAKLYSKDKLGACQEFEKAKQLGDTIVDELIQKNCK